MLGRKDNSAADTARGASRRRGPAAAPSNPGCIRRWLSAVAALGVMAVAGYFLTGYVEATLARPVAKVAVEGDFRFVSRARVEALVQPQIDNSFLRLDLARIKRVLEQEPWIDRASLGRRWPDRLIITIAEQQPIARWGDGGILNQRGELVVVEDNGRLNHLPVLYSQAGRESQLLAQYQDLSVLLRSRQLQMTELSCDEKHAWSLTLSNGLKVVIGRDQVMEKMRRFLRVYDAVLVEDLARVESVDVRYNNGVAVNWREPQAAIAVRRFEHYSGQDNVGDKVVTYLRG